MIKCSLWVIILASQHSNISIFNSTASLEMLHMVEVFSISPVSFLAIVITNIQI